MKASFSWVRVAHNKTAWMIFIVKNEKRFVEQLKKGDTESFHQLIREYSPILYHYGLRFISNKKEIEDLVQETFLAVLEGIDRFRGESSLKTWMIQIFHHKAYRLFKNQKREPVFEEDTLNQISHFDERGQWKEEVLEWDINPETAVMGKELREVLYSAIDNLPDPYKQVLLLRDIQQIEAPDVCNILQLSPTNMRVILHRARLRVKAEVDGFMRKDRRDDHL